MNLPYRMFYSKTFYLDSRMKIYYIQAIFDVRNFCNLVLAETRTKYGSCMSCAKIYH